MTSARLRRSLPLVDSIGRPSAPTRRDFLGVVTAGFTLAGLAACSRGPREKIFPYVVQPREVTPGVPRWYATTLPIDGYGVGLLVESHEGRPTKVEGNPAHPASLGAAGVYEQASVLGLYDPDRLRGIQEGTLPRSWSAFAEAMAAPIPEGKELHVLLEPTSSPLVIEWISRLRMARPEARVSFYAPLARDAVWSGARLAFGRPLETRLDLRRADVIVALDADPLASGPGALAYARQYADRRRVRSTNDRMNRLYVAEPVLSVTGMNADDRISVRAREIPHLARALLAEIVAARRAGVPRSLLDAAQTWKESPHAAWVQAVARDLLVHAGRSVVVAGDGLPAEAHAAVHAINALLGNDGTTVTYAEPVPFEAGGESHGLSTLMAALDAQVVDTVVIAGGNPSYTAPADYDLSRRLRAVPRTVYLGPYANETARDCRWVLPEAHYLETWGDARAYDGTISLTQPLIAPLYDGRAVVEVLAAIAGRAEASPHALLLEAWNAKQRTSFEEFWEAALKVGVIEGSAAKPIAPAIAWGAMVEPLARIGAARPGLTLTFRPDASVHDGRFANNPWLQELPDPVTKQAWGNAAILSQDTAARLGVENEGGVELNVRGRTVLATALVVPGTAEDTVALALGYGRSGAESVARDVGTNAYVLRTSRAPYEDDVLVRPVSAATPLAIAQRHWTAEDRPLAIALTWERYRQDPRTLAERNEMPVTLYSRGFRHTSTAASAAENGPQWAMAIDLNVCTGCSACVIACQSENNVPTVGKLGVEKGRSMHWLRIDRYFDGPPESPRVAVQPMLCQHCEKAPCEYVCPVNATVHSSDGLNEMVYNRCVGTRFCSNNCPYKVRRFNWFNYTRDLPDTVQLAMNPDVTVRARGVMEKCTYCVQRIREAEIRARRERRPIRDGEIQTACAQACPTRAIVFGSLSDPKSEVAALHANERTYQVLHELGTVPRTRYLARLINPNSELAGT